VPDDPDAVRAKAEAKFKKNEDLRQEGEKAKTEYEAEARARDEKTARLRALRLAKEAADREAGNPPSKSTAKPPK